MELREKVVVVTGSGNGIGEAFVRRFAAEGARVVVTDVEADSAARVAADIGAVSIPAEVTVEDEVRAVARFAEEVYGPVDVWYSNAGYSGPAAPGDLQDDAVWDLMWKLHVMSHVYAARAVLPSMVERGEGYLLATASSSGLQGHVSKVAYSVTKTATVALCEWLAGHYRPKGIRVSCLCPGPMMTRMLRSNELPEDHPLMLSARTPEQMAELVTEAIRDERLLILTEDDLPEVSLAAKAADYGDWIVRRYGAGGPG